MHADSPFAGTRDTTESPETPDRADTPDTDSAEVHTGPAVTDAQLDAVDTMHDAQDAGEVIDAEVPDGSIAGDEGGDIDTSIAGAAAPLDQTLTECRCEKCGTKAKWVGPLTAEMLTDTFTRGVDEASGLPNCVHCGTAMVAVEFLKAEEAISKAAETLDAERAGDAARPMYQPPLPGTMPPFDWRTAQLRTEHLESAAAGAESAWDEAKEEASARKKDYDAAIEALRKHIQNTHAARVEAEYKHRGDSPIAGTPDLNAPLTTSGTTSTAAGACLTERTTGKPCPICRNVTLPPADHDTSSHLAASVLALALEETLEPASLAAALREVLRLIVPLDTIGRWTSQDVQILARYLQATAGDSEEARASKPVPLVLGRAHEIGGEMGRGCRICGALMHQLAVDEGFPEGFPIGQRVGTDCAGEAENAAEPVRTTKPRHTKKADRQQAKQASSTKDHAAEQKAEGKKRTAKATLKGGAKKGSKKS